MSVTGKELLPKARKNDLVMEELSDEVLVYDLDRHRALCLNESAAFVWKLCDGRTTVAKATERLGERYDAPVDEDVVRLALDRLGRAHLLESRPKQAMKGNGISRRDVIRKLGLATAVALPLVTSILAPTAYAAGSPIPAADCAKFKCDQCAGAGGDSVKCFPAATGGVGTCQCENGSCKCIK